MAPREAWDDVVERILAGGDSLASPYLADLDALALKDGRAALKSFRALDGERQTDLILDLLTESLAAVVAADNPRAFFVVSVRRRAIS